MSHPLASPSPHAPPNTSRAAHAYDLPPIHYNDSQSMNIPARPATPASQSLPSIGALLSPRQSCTDAHPTTKPTMPLTPQHHSRQQPQHQTAWNPQSPFSPDFAHKVPFDLTDIKAHRREMARGFLPSPPNSAELPLSHSFSSHKDDDDEDPHTASDPELYRADTPATQGAESLALFATDPDVLLDADISKHIADTSEHFSHHHTAPPSRQDYYCVARVFKVIKAMGLPAYLDQEEHFLNQYWGTRLTKPQPHSSRAATRKVLQHASGNRRQLKPLAPKASTDSRRLTTSSGKIVSSGSVAVGVAPRSPRAPRPSHRRRGSAAPIALDAEGRPVPPRTKVVKPKEEYNYAQFPDYAPAPTTMKSGLHHANQIKWTGANSQSDLTNDPDRAHLSEPELIVASKLRLTCAKYLCQKRRIFIHLLDILRQGKEFKKTNCQDVRMIDVNKLSTLWVFYHAIGWFDRSHYEHLL